MTKILYTAAVAALALGFAPNAFAQDAATAPEMAPAPEAASAQYAAPAPLADEQPFSGLYVAASGGYDFQGNDIGSRIQFDRNGDGRFGDGITDQVSTAAGADAFSPGFCNGRAYNASPLRGCKNDRDRASYYGRVGFDIQRGPFVLGALGEFGKTGIKDYVTGFSTTPAFYTLERSVKWEASARLRAGVAFGEGPQAGLFYATGGAGYADIRHRFFTNNTANAFSDNGDDKKWGFVVGGGVEKFLTRNISIGAEYTYHDYKDGDYRVRVTQGTAPATNPFVLAPNTAGTTIRRADDNFRWHSLRGTIGFHF